MNGKLRRDKILEIMNEQGYVTVKMLTETLFYSSATINRDLNVLQSQKLIKRSYGGAELVKSRSVPLIFRYDKEKKEKRFIAKTAASFVENGDTIFLYATTTTEYMIRYLTEKKDVTVITNNMAAATFLANYNINVVCLGGSVVEIPSFLNGDITVENAERFIADKMFFSVASIDDKGRIYGGNHLVKTMMKNSDKCFLLVDHAKTNKTAGKVVFCDLSKVDYVISDGKFEKNIKEKYNNTVFVDMENNKNNQGDL